MPLCMAILLMFGQKRETLHITSIPKLKEKIRECDILMRMFK